MFRCLRVYIDFQTLSLAYTRGTNNSLFALNLSFSSLNLSLIFFHSSTPLSLLHTQRKRLSFLSISFLSFAVFFGLSLFSIPLACSLSRSFSVFQSLCLSLPRALKSLNLFNSRFLNRFLAQLLSVSLNLSFSFNLIFSDSPNPPSLSLHMQRKRFFGSLNPPFFCSISLPHSLYLSLTLQSLSISYTRSVRDFLSHPISVSSAQSLFLILFVFL